MVQAERVIEGVHLVVVEDADPVRKPGDIDGQHLLEEDPAFLSFDLGLRPSQAGAGRCRRRRDRDNGSDETGRGDNHGVTLSLLGGVAGLAIKGGGLSFRYTTTDPPDRPNASPKTDVPLAKLR
ncbi:MAG TPA: hypothetical protein VE465_28390 [Streptosporangiaceae bacterium]|nr:hypothetical protein [Streptosporangiaceae bacterium]